MLTSVHNYVIVPSGTERAVDWRQLDELGPRPGHAQYPHAGPPYATTKHILLNVIDMLRSVSPKRI